jgi:hypothetical protein
MQLHMLPAVCIKGIIVCTAELYCRRSGARHTLFCKLTVQPLGDLGIWANPKYLFLGVFVTREHVCHNKSGIAHRGRTGINH